MLARGDLHGSAQSCTPVPQNRPGGFVSERRAAGPTVRFPALALDHHLTRCGWTGAGSNATPSPASRATTAGARPPSRLRWHVAPGRRPWRRRFSTRPLDPGEPPCRCRSRSRTRRCRTWAGCPSSDCRGGAPGDRGGSPARPGVWRSSSTGSACRPGACGGFAPPTDSTKPRRGVVHPLALAGAPSTSPSTGCTGANAAGRCVRPVRHVDTVTTPEGAASGIEPRGGNANLLRVAADRAGRGGAGVHP